MPKRTVLYYPGIPRTGYWLRQAVLYWDEVGSFNTGMGNKLYGFDEEFSPDIRYLQDEGIYRIFSADRFFKDEGLKVAKFEEEFKALIHGFDLKPFIDRDEVLTYSLFEQDKIPQSLIQLLAGTNIRQLPNDPKFTGLAPLAYPDQKGGKLFVHVFAYLILAALLAQHLADEDSESTVTATWWGELEHVILQARSNAPGVPCLGTRFQNTIPTPREDVPFQKIVAFRQKRRQELLQFRELMDKFQKDLRNSNGESEVKEKVVSFSEQLEKGINELEVVLQDSKLATVAGSMKALIKLDSPTLWASILVAAGEATKVTEIPLEWAVVGSATLGAVQVFGTLVDERNRQRAELRKSSFSYLYYAKQEKITK